MARNIKEIPFTELVERIMATARDEGGETKARGMVNDVYSKEIPRGYDWSFLESSTSILCVAKFNSGTVSINSGNSACVFVGMAVTTDMTGRKIKFTGNDNIYEFTYVASNSGSVSPVLSGDKNIANGSYTMFQPIYTLPSDFDRFPKNGGLLKYIGGKPTPISELPTSGYYDNYSSTPSDTPIGCKLTTNDTAGNPRIEIIPPPNTAIVLGCDYLKFLKPMKENSSGTVAITSSDTVAYFSTANLSEVNTGDYLRVNALGVKGDSNWYRIMAKNGTALTITTFATGTNVSSAEYVISSCPEIPANMHDALIWGTLRNTVVDQNDPQYLFYNHKFAQVMTDGKRLYKSRIPNYPFTGVFEETGYRR